MQEQWLKELQEQVKKDLEQYSAFRLPLDSARADAELLIAGKSIFVQDTSGTSARATVKLNKIKPNTTGDDGLILKSGSEVKAVFTKLFLSNTAQAGQWLDLVVGRDFDMAVSGDVAVTIPEPLSVDDNGGSLTVDGAVSVDDGGGSLTIDGTVAISAVGGNVTVIDGGGSITVDDGGGVLTVDGTVAISGTVTTDDKEGSAQPCIIITNASADTNTPGAANACKVALVRAHTTNTGLVWVNTGAAAAEGSCYPLDAGDAVSFRTTNTNQINALFKVANEKVTVLYQN